MKRKQLTLLLIALLLPSGIFVFLKMFGKNKFEVPVLYSQDIPKFAADCGIDYKLPYAVPDSVISSLDFPKDSIACVFFMDDSAGILTRVRNRYPEEPVQWKVFPAAENSFKRRCIFLLQEPFDIVLVDRRGGIRGQYNSSKRDEIDRLITELAIILKKY